MDLTPQPADFMTPEPGVSKPFISIMVRVGSWILTNAGLHRWYRIPSVNGKYHTHDWRRVL